MDPRELWVFYAVAGGVGACIVLFVAVLIHQSMEASKSRKAADRAMESQRKAIEALGKELAGQLEGFASEYLNDGLMKFCVGLVQKGLAPTEAENGRRLTEFAEELRQGQQEGMEELAHILYAKLRENMLGFTAAQGEAASQLRLCADALAKQMTARTDELERAAGPQQEAITAFTDAFAASAARTQELSQRICTLHEGLDTVAASVAAMTQNLSAQALAVEQLNGAAAASQQDVQQAYALLGRSSQEVSRIFSDAVAEMKLSSVQTAAQVVDGLKEGIDGVAVGIALQQKDFVEVMEGSLRRSSELLESSSHSHVDLLQERFDATVEKIDAISKAAEETLRQNSELFESSSRSNTESLQGAFDATTEKIGLISKAMEDSLTAMSGLITGLQESAAKSSADIAAASKALSEDMSFRLDSVAGVLSTSLESGYDKIEMGAQAYGQTFAGSLAALREQLEEQLRSISINAAGIQSESENLNKAILNSSENFGKGLDVALNDALSSFDEALSQIVERVAETAKSVKEASDALPATIRVIKASEV